MEEGEIQGIRVALIHIFIGALLCIGECIGES